MRHYPLQPRERQRKLRHDDNRLKMHPRVEALVKILAKLPDDGTPHPLPSHYGKAKVPSRLAYDDWRRIRAALWPDWVVRFTSWPATVRRTA